MNDFKRIFRTLIRPPIAIMSALMVIGSLLTVTAVGSAGAQTDNAISGLSAQDITNSVNAARLVDGTTGTEFEDSWENPSPWEADRYPMVAEIDLGATYTLESMRYFVGNLSRDTANVLFEYSGDATGDDFTWLHRQDFDHTWNSFSEVPLTGQWARRVRVIFLERSDRFNISEIEFFGLPVDGNNGGGDNNGGDNNGGGGGAVEAAGACSVAVTGGTATLTWNAVDGVSDYQVRSTAPGGSEQWRATINGQPLWENNSHVAGETYLVRYRVAGEAIDLGCSGAPGDDNNNIDDDDNNNGGDDNNDNDGDDNNIDDNNNDGDDNNDDNNNGDDNNNDDNNNDDGDEPFIPGVNDMPRSAQPGPDIVRAMHFGQWPNDHLTEACKDLHDRYWVQGQNVGISDDPNHPDNIAYPTWHPAIETHPETGETCDYGHEHGTSPALAPLDMFELSGGWPAFGYVATHAGPPRHEDHVGHKVTVARFRAAIGNGSGSETLYDAGFECGWLSKIHQGSHSMDAFSNHLHEYFLTVRCFDGLNDQGIRDGQTVGTQFSVKIMFAYGRPNRFVEENCAAGADFDVSVLTDPDGQPINRAQRETPVGNNSSNDRAFVCSDALLYQTLDQDSTTANPLAYADLWNELIKIERSDGSSAMTFQPYYAVKNPSRVIEGFPAGSQPSQVVRTIDLCYGTNGELLNLPLCEGAPPTNPGFDSPLSPFNGALRAVHFKAIDQLNADGPPVFCTDPFGRAVVDALPCDAGNVEQRISSYTNGFNRPDFTHNGRSGNVAGSIWAEVVGGERTTTEPSGDGGFVPNGIGFEFVIDNRNPDDDNDGVPDGANIRGRN